MMAFCPEHPKWDQNPKFTPLSETTSIPTPFICGVPLRYSARFQRDETPWVSCFNHWRRIPVKLFVLTSDVTVTLRYLAPEVSIVVLVEIENQLVTGLFPTVIRFQRQVSNFESSYLTQRLGVINQKKSHWDPVINHWHVLFHIGLYFNGHLEFVPTFLCSLYLTLHKTDITRRRTLCAGPKSVLFRESGHYPPQPLSQV